MRVGVLVSGNGTNLQALLDAAARNELGVAQIAVVISNIPNVPALARAQRAQVPHAVVAHRDFASREAFDRAMAAELDAHQVEAVVLAGFMRILSPWFVARYPARIINTHPSLLPAFPGKDAPAQALAYGAKLSGVSVHFVDASLDGGPLIAQRAVPVRADDTAHSLHLRIQQQEHALLPSVVKALASGALTVSGRHVLGHDSDGHA
ncbi:MAG TPA: phosphoribosylglycinamide formyltransferase [Kofleriaceae bacterium]|nr:phosphoribosylglycinamide formyltransferase [Kofleriaceae bacterium]